MFLQERSSFVNCLGAAEKLISRIRESVSFQFHHISQPMKGFKVLLVGGSGNVGRSVVSSLLKVGECEKIVLVLRRPLHLGNPRIQEVCSEFAAATFADEVKTLVVSNGIDRAASCLGIGSGSASMSEDEVKHLEVEIAGAFAQGCHDGGVRHFCLLSAAGADKNSNFRYARIMGLKEEVVARFGFATFDVFRPGIIAGNANTPLWATWLGYLVPGNWGAIEQVDIGRSFANRLKEEPLDGLVLHNADMRKQSMLLK
jgi:uncharacterized protein YbjT (DUF2867 family)